MMLFTLSDAASWLSLLPILFHTPHAEAVGFADAFFAAMLSTCFRHAAIAAFHDESAISQRCRFLLLLLRLRLMRPPSGADITSCLPDYAIFAIFDYAYFASLRLRLMLLSRYADDAADFHWPFDFIFITLSIFSPASAFAGQMPALLADCCQIARYFAEGFLFRFR